MSDENRIYTSSAVREVYVPRVGELIVLDRNAVKLHTKLIVLPSEGLSALVVRT